MRVKMIIDTGFVGATHEETVEITPEDLENTTLEEYCAQYLQDMIANYIDAHYEVIED